MTARQFATLVLVLFACAACAWFAYQEGRHDGYAAAMAMQERLVRTPTTETKPAWRTESHKDPITDRESWTAVGEGSGGLSLTVRCTGNYLSVSVYHPNLYASGGAYLFYRADAKDGVTYEHWDGSDHYVSAPDAKKFLAYAVPSSTLIMRASTANSSMGDETIVMDSAGEYVDYVVNKCAAGKSEAATAK